MSLGHRLRELRKEKKLTIREVSEIFNIGKSTVSDYENNKRSPNYEMLKMFSEFYSVTIDFLLGITSEKNIYTSKAANLPQELRDVGVDYIALAKEFEDNDIPPEDVKKILDALKNIKK